MLGKKINAMMCMTALPEAMLVLPLGRRPHSDCECFASLQMTLAEKEAEEVWSCSMVVLEFRSHRVRVKKNRHSKGLDWSEHEAQIFGEVRM